MAYKKDEVTRQHFIHDKVEKHETKLVRIETILERVATNQDKMAEALSSISDSILKQELLLEKLTNLEENTKISINRVHKRIDSVDEKMKVKADQDDVEEHANKLKILEPVIFFSKYPKLAVMIIASMYLFTIKEVRDVIFNIFKVIG
mgnify:CR=1 FL=1